MPNKIELYNQQAQKSGKKIKQKAEKISPNYAVGATTNRLNRRNVLGRDLEDVTEDVVLDVFPAVGRTPLNFRARGFVLHFLRASDWDEIRLKFRWNEKMSSLYLYLYLSTRLYIYIYGKRWGKVEESVWVHRVERGTVRLCVEFELSTLNFEYTQKEK